MSYPHCPRCQGRRACRDETISWIIIFVGLIATVAVRVVTILMNLNPLWGKTAWYSGIIGFIIFFSYKFKVFKQRAAIIDSHHLIKKLASNESLSPQDREVLSVILCKIRSNKERLNFLFIFTASFIALVVAIYFDFFQ